MKSQPTEVIANSFFSNLGLSRQDVKGCRLALDDRDYDNEKVVFYEKSLVIPKGMDEDEEIELISSKGKIQLLSDTVGIAIYNALNSNLEQGQVVPFRYGCLSQVGFPMLCTGLIEPRSMDEEDIYEYSDGEKNARIFGVDTKSRIFPLIGEDSYLRVQDEGVIRIQTTAVHGLSNEYLGEGYSRGVGVAQMTAIMMQM